MVDSHKVVGSLGRTLLVGGLLQVVGCLEQHQSRTLAACGQVVVVVSVTDMSLNVDGQLTQLHRGRYPVTKSPVIYMCTVYWLWPASSDNGINTASISDPEVSLTLDEDGEPMVSDRPLGCSEGP
eukprot:g36959.t1